MASRGPPMRIARGSERELGGSGRIVAQEQLVAADARVVIDVARLGHADDRMDEQVGFFLLRGAERELVVCAVHRVAGLEGDDVAPALVREVVAEFGGCLAERL